MRKHRIKLCSNKAIVAHGVYYDTNNISFSEKLPVKDTAGNVIGEIINIFTTDTGVYGDVVYSENRCRCGFKITDGSDTCRDCWEENWQYRY